MFSYYFIQSKFIFFHFFRFKNKSNYFTKSYVVVEIKFINKMKMKVQPRLHYLFNNIKSLQMNKQLFLIIPFSLFLIPQFLWCQSSQWKGFWLHAHVCVFFHVCVCVCVWVCECVGVCANIKPQKIPSRSAGV